MASPRLQLWHLSPIEDLGGPKAGHYLGRDGPADGVEEVHQDGVTESYYWDRINQARDQWPGMVASSGKPQH